MAHVPEVVLDLYDGVPKDCFVSGLPFTLRGHEDNEVIPSFDTVSGPNGVASKWVRFSDYLPFIDGCNAYWMGSFDLEHPVYVYVMPYTPLRDAYYLHERVIDADALPTDPFASQDQSMDIAQEIGDEVSQLKQAKVEISEGVQFTFFIVNYRLLWSKAKIYCDLSYMSTPLDEFLRRVDICANLLQANAPTLATEQQLVTAADDAKRLLALVLMEKYTQGILGVDPHDALLAMYPEMHHEVYQKCKCDHPNPKDEEEPANSVIESAMKKLGYEDTDTDDDLSIPQAELNLINAEGVVEFSSYKRNACARFLNSRNVITSAINPTRDYVREATTSHCLMGVIPRYEDGNPDEGN